MKKPQIKLQILLSSGAVEEHEETKQLLCSSGFWRLRASKNQITSLASTLILTMTFKNYVRE